MKNNHFIHSLLGTLQQMRFSLHQNHVHVCTDREMLGTECWGSILHGLVIKIPKIPLNVR